MMSSMEQSNTLNDAEIFIIGTMQLTRYIHSTRTYIYILVYVHDLF